MTGLPAAVATVLAGAARCRRSRRANGHGRGLVSPSCHWPGRPKDATAHPHPWHYCIGEGLVAVYVEALAASGPPGRRSPRPCPDMAWTGHWTWTSPFPRQRGRRRGVDPRDGARRSRRSRSSAPQLGACPPRPRRSPASDRRRSSCSIRRRSPTRSSRRWPRTRPRCRIRTSETAVRESSADSNPAWPDEDVRAKAEVLIELEIEAARAGPARQRRLRLRSRRPVRLPPPSGVPTWLVRGDPAAGSLARRRTPLSPAYAALIGAGSHHHAGGCPARSAARIHPGRDDQALLRRPRELISPERQVRLWPRI